MKLCVMGLGYIGLPTAVMFAKHDLDVHGVDTNPSVIDSLLKKQPHINEPGLKEQMISVLDSGSLTVSTEPQAADAFILAVPTPITEEKKANLSYVEAAARMILPFLQKGNLVILESTVPPMTIENLLIPILKESGFTIGEDLFVAHSPERVLPGRLFEELISNDRIVGGINEESCLRTLMLYKYFVKGNIYMTDARTAEMVKLIENTYRDVNIALANELAVIGEKLSINMWEAITLANYHPRVQLHAPGPGVGGHCIAVDPWFIIEQAPEESNLISMARKINDSAPNRMVKLIESTISHLSNPTITLLGLSYKGNIDDVRESPSLVILSQLVEKGYKIKIHDPYVKSTYPGSAESLEEAAKDTDCLVILTDHNEYKLTDFNVLADLFHTRIIIDTRNILNHQNLRENGFTCLQIGTTLN